MAAIHGLRPDDSTDVLPTSSVQFVNVTRTFSLVARDISTAILLIHIHVAARRHTSQHFYTTG
ncbi:hypothetical protein DPMN_056019 [Dreissena polymorpha]|uniref:Uncharacterized protein n=1 Tax=Dreissena polymorpha TaxID=45954 RepID=A0A9D4CTP5_DREPO|nr:hypothetical protein DPMN_056019 [Dreissena polymorpha]